MCRNCDSVFRSDSYIQGSRSISFIVNTFSLTFRPVLPKGLLFFASQRMSGRGDFLSVSLIDGHVSLDLDVGHGRLHLNSTSRLAMNALHTLTFSHNRRRGTLVVNEEAPLTGQTPGSLIALNLLRPALLYIGGVPSSVTALPAGISSTSLRGCVTDFSINGRNVDLGSATVVRHGVARGHCDDSCVGVACERGSDCVPDLERFDFACNCSLYFTGKLCDKIMDLCYDDFCSNEGNCHTSLSGLDSSLKLEPICTCPDYTTGIRCESILDWVPRRFNDASTPPARWFAENDIAIRFR
eukprot:m.256247 g.256247  ORF g.256247 m.256247 type:complete len:297 (+) comp40400_c1_seq63:679-1569(+)